MLEEKYMKSRDKAFSEIRKKCEALSDRHPPLGSKYVLSRSSINIPAVLIARTYLTEEMMRLGRLYNRMEAKPKFQ